MSNSDERRHRLVTMILSRVKPDGEVDIAHDDQSEMSSATFYRAMKDLEEEALIGRVQPGTYRCSLPPPLLASDPDLRDYLDMAESFYGFMDAVGAAAQEFHRGFFVKFMELVIRKRNRCMSCDDYEDCFNGRVEKCPYLEFKADPGATVADHMKRFQSAVFSREKFSGENHISYIEEGSGEEKRFSRENGESVLREEGEDPPPPPPTRADPRVLLKRRLEDSRAAARDKPPTARAQAKEIKELWDKCLEGIHGDGFVAPRWGAKEWKNFPMIIKNYDLELTKQAILLYFKEWENIKKENPWIDAPTPTTGLFLHFQDRLFAAVQGRGRVVGERVSKRTSDEPDYEAPDGTDISTFPEATAAHDA